MASNLKALVRFLIFLINLEPEEFLEHTKLEMYSDQVFVFSPNGDLISLPKGAMPIDFAFAVHTDIGLNCIGVKINNSIKPLYTKLKWGPSRSYNW